LLALPPEIKEDAMKKPPVEMVKTAGDICACVEKLESAVHRIESVLKRCEV
jgi:hypothetical protein